MTKGGSEEKRLKINYNASETDVKVLGRTFVSTPKRSRKFCQSRKKHEIKI